MIRSTRSKAIRWLRERGVAAKYDDLSRARRVGRIAAIWIHGRSRYRVDDVERLAHAWR